MVLDPPPPVRPEKVESEAVLLGVVEAEKPMAKLRPLVGVEQTLEDGVLDPLAEIEAFLRGLAEAAAACSILRRYVVAHYDEHGHESLPYEGRVTIEVAAKIAGQEKTLEIREQAD